MSNKYLLDYSIQIAMLKQLKKKKLITESEYRLIFNQLRKKYGVVSDMTV